MTSDQKSQKLLLATGHWHWPLALATGTDKRIMQIIDTHAHLDQVPDIENALKRAHDAQVSDIVVMGVDLKANIRNLELKKLFNEPRIHLAFGIHPGNISDRDVIPAQAGIQRDAEWTPAFAGVTKDPLEFIPAKTGTGMTTIDATFEFIRAHIKEAAAIGETGLDYSYKWARKNEVEQQKQRDIFQKHLNLAKEFDLPVVIHSRGAERDCLSMAKAAGIVRANFHWYSGPVDILKEILECGFFISCSPSIAYSSQSRAAINYAPIERTLIETDSPVYFRMTTEEGFQAEPKDVWRTLKSYAALKSIDEQAALDVFNKNARTFFGI